jgi:PAS domain S-box-containing protein
MNEPGRAGASPTDDGRYRLLIDAITDYAIYMLDLDGRVTSWNPGAQRFKGYLASEIIGRHFSVFYTEEEQRAGVPALALRTAAGEGRFEREGWRVRKDGSRFWAHVVIDPIKAPDGALIGYAKITRDLTERRAAEQALQHSEQQFRLLVQGVTDYAIYMLDPEGRLTNWNAGAERIKGYAAEDVIGRSFSMFYTEADREAGLPRRGLETAAREGRWEHEGWRVKKDGGRFWAHVVIDAIRDQTGQLLGYAKVTRDVTERMEAQRELDLAREALFQSQKLEAIGQLTGGVAHDFNNLLAAILGSLELVRKRLPYDPRISPLIDNAIHGAQRGAALTQRMLVFARKQELSLEAVELSSLVAGMESFVQRTIGPGISVDVRVPAGLPPVRTDPNQLEAALLNLAVNARDAMPDGGVVTITGRRSVVEDKAGGLEPGAYVCLAVNDTGQGMDAETLARATEPFFTTKGVGKGTGLGLSMAHGLAAHSGGALRLNSAVGEGTSVEFWLPVALAGEGRAAAAPSGGSVVSDRHLRILAVDDDSLVLLNTVAMLEDLGHEVFPTSSADEALELLKRTPGVELVITDQAMPGLTGAQLAEQLHAACPGLPVIIASGYDELPQGAAIDQRLRKPFTQEVLARAISDAAAAMPAALAIG